jgi:hypothetical protein
MLQSSPSTEADRIALTNMFRAIAEYGRRIRQRREAEGQKDAQIESTEPKHDSGGQGALVNNLIKRKRVKVKSILKIK